MGSSNCEICNENDYLDEYSIVGMDKNIYACMNCVEEGLRLRIKELSAEQSFSAEEERWALGMNHREGVRGIHTVGCNGNKEKGQNEPIRNWKEDSDTFTSKQIAQALYTNLEESESLGEGRTGNTLKELIKAQSGLIKLHNCCKKVNTDNLLSTTFIVDLDAESFAANPQGRPHCEPCAERGFSYYGIKTCSDCGLILCKRCFGDGEICKSCGDVECENCGDMESPDWIFTTPHGEFCVDCRNAWIEDPDAYEAESFNVEFNEWADQEMNSHGKNISFKDWADDEGLKHGNTEITDWAQHEDESHDARYGAEELKRDSCCCGATKTHPCACMIQGIETCSATCPCSLEKKGAETYEDSWEKGVIRLAIDSGCFSDEYAEWVYRQIDGASSTLNNPRFKKIIDKRWGLNAENWGGDPEGKLALALQKARDKSKEPRKPLKIEKLDAEIDGEELIASSANFGDGSMIVGVGTETLDVDNPDFMEMMIDKDGKIEYFTLPIGLDGWDRHYNVKPSHYGKMKTQNETNESTGGDFIRTDGDGKYAESFSAPTKGIDTFTKPFEESSLDSGTVKSIVIGLGIGALALFGYNKWK